MDIFSVLEDYHSLETLSQQLLSHQLQLLQPKRCKGTLSQHMMITKFRIIMLNLLSTDSVEFVLDPLQYYVFCW
jgi:hypothetical protein